MTDKFPLPKAEEAIVLIESIGYQLKGGDGGHRKYKHPMLSSLNIPFHQGQSLPYHIVKQIANALGLERKDFIRLARSKKFRKQYKKDLDAGLIRSKK